MVILHAIAGAGAALLAGGGALVLGHGPASAALAYAAGGAAGILASAALVAASRRPGRGAHGEAHGEDWEGEADRSARLIAGAERRIADRVVRLGRPGGRPVGDGRPGGRNGGRIGARERRRPDLPADPRLAPDWLLAPRAGCAGGWPDEIPPDLRLRLLEATSQRGAAPEDLWDAIRGWLAEHGAACPPELREAGPDDGRAPRRH